MSDKKLLILGMGLQGKGALYDVLAHNTFAQITVADCGPRYESEKADYEARGVRALTVDANDEQVLRRLVAEHDVVIELLPVSLAMKVGRIAAESGVHLVSSMYYIGQSMTDPVVFERMKREMEEIDEAARRNGCTLLIAFGMDPGLDLMLGADALSRMDEIEHFYSYGAGFPEQAACNNALSYKFSWSPRSTLVSYFRETKKIVDGQVVSVPADKLFAPENTHILHDETLDCDLECYAAGNCQNFAEMFGISGKVRNMNRFSARLPGHCAFWDVMVRSGFLREEPVMVNGVPVSPLEFCTALLTSQQQFWYRKDERDVGYIRVEARGRKDGAPVSVTHTIIDYADLQAGLTSMQRLVGFTVAIAASLIANGDFAERGLILPMRMPLSLMQPELAKRDIHIVTQIG
ncbi:saccharopine dehydrogenase family protein [uncultured Bilophila sp.]|uniref:saccharopine dehydrogenase family protein n=1 Tax=uncultured Bilophila sp. TaxID=529385 RepID=UPI0026DAA37A|nr:saccharopine dehydrogenase C-terminal domain-containing protein [uncultured Bilophila sp.]